MYEYVNCSSRKLGKNLLREILFGRCMVVKLRSWCGGLVVSVPASRPPFPGSYLVPGPPHSAVTGVADPHCNTVHIMQLNLKGLGGLEK